MIETYTTYGVCNLSIVPVRLEASDTSQMINQLLFGEYFLVLEKSCYWSKIQLSYDGSVGFVDNKQYAELTQVEYENISEKTSFLAGELIDYIVDEQNFLTTIPLGSLLPNFNNGQIILNNFRYVYDGEISTGIKPKIDLIKTAFLFLNVPFLLGGKSPFGIDASGFTQMVYRLCGYQLSRTSEQQALEGEVLSFIEESEPGDLAFFDDELGNITHVGIVMSDYNIIHAFGKVRIDKLDHSGIYNVDLKKHTHRLRMIKKLV